jgi:RsiW-degrading membrane proteinase PrsW (M82 family)
VVPAVLLLLFFYYNDKNPEPRTIVIITFLLGVAICVPVLLLGLPLKAWLLHFVPLDRQLLAEQNILQSSSPYLLAAVLAFAVAAFLEETFKFLVVWLYCSRQKAFDEPMDGIVYGVTASLGFAALENVMYASQFGGWEVVISRAFTAVPMHAFLGAIMGYYIGQAKFKGHFGGMLLGLFCSFLLHGLYDFFLMVPAFASPDWKADNHIVILVCYGLSVLTLIGAGFWAILLINRARAEQSESAS